MDITGLPAAYAGVSLKELGPSAPAPFSYPRTQEEQMGWLLRRALILAAPFIWRKYKERRRRSG